jgi:hypothetical protein
MRVLLYVNYITDIVTCAERVLGQLCILVSSLIWSSAGVWVFWHFNAVLLGY